MEAKANTSSYHGDTSPSQSIQWEYDPAEDRYLHIDKTITQLTGYSLEEWISPCFRETHIHEDDRDWATSAPDDENTFEKEYRIKSKSGDVIWVRDTITVVKEPGLPTHLHGNMTNISDQKAVENAMQMLATGVVDDDDDQFFYECVQNIANVYNAKYTLIGILSEDKLSIKTLAVWADGQLANNFEYDLLHTPCADVLCEAKELIPANVTKLYPKDELLISMGVESYFGTPLTPVNQEMTGLVAILDDKPMKLTSWTAPVLSLFSSRIATELKKREQNTTLKHMMKEAQAANIAKSEFLANISHELRTPMHGILAYSEFGEKKFSEAPREKLGKYYSNINSSANRLMLLINDLLDISKLESGKVNLNKECNRLHQLALVCIKDQKPSIKKKNLNIEVSEEKDLNTITFDKTKMSQVINNLLSNAIKYSPEGSNIIIKIFNTKLNAQEAVGFTLFNEGQSIPDNELVSIFDKFIQSSLTKDGSGGTGLGLAICKEILFAHNGGIWAKENIKNGASFEFNLPADN